MHEKTGYPKRPPTTIRAEKLKKNILSFESANVRDYFIVDSIMISAKVNDADA